MKFLNIIKRYAWLIIFLIFNTALMLSAAWIEEVDFASRYYPSFIGFVYAQFGLLAIWCSFSAVPWWIRLPTTLLIAVGYLYLISLVDAKDFWKNGDHEIFYGSNLLLAVIAGGLLRPFIGTIRQKSDLDKNRRSQISILTMLGWVTAVAVLIAFVNARWQIYAESGSGLDYAKMSLVAFATTLMVGYSLFSRWPLIASIVALIFSWAAGMVTLYVLHGISRFSSDYIWHFGMISFSQCVMMLVTLTAVRIAGYQATSRLDRSNVLAQR